MSLSDRWPLTGLTDVRDDLLRAWDRPGYHDLLHLAEVLDRLDELAAAGAEFDPVTVGLAAWFHDAVYDGVGDDEERSARWAEDALPAPYAGAAARLVRMTAHHRPDGDDADGCALSDADLAVLAAGPERYDAYVHGVRADFAHVSDQDFRAGRAAVLAALVDGERLFHTPQGRRMWEDAARANVARELAGLTEG